MTPRCIFLVAVIAIACLVHHVSSIAPYYAARADAERVGKGKYIVVLKEDEDAKMDAISFVTREFLSRSERERSSSSYKIEHTYDHVISGFSATLTDDLREKMRSLPEVKYIEEVVPVFPQCFGSTPPPPPPKWGLDRIDQRDLPLDNGDLSYQENGGAGVHIYIVDTGVQRTHNEFKGRFSDDGFNEYPDDGFGKDCWGHGTHVAATAAGATYGVASKATIHSVRTFNCAGEGNNGGLIRGMDWIAANYVLPAVASMSVGSVKSKAVNDAVEKLFGMGIVVSVAAGNENTDACDRSPSSAPNAITVGATDIDDKRAVFGNGQASNFGSCLDIFAPGKEITSAGIGSDDATAIMSGTSMACPHVSGVAAILLGRDPKLTPAKIAAKLTNLSTENRLSDIKRGSPNCILYID